MSISKDVEFLPLFHTNSNTLKGHEGANKQRRSSSFEGRNLEEQQQQEEEAYDDDFYTSTQTSTGAHDANNPFSTQPFVEGMGSYDQYAQVSMKHQQQQQQQQQSSYLYFGAYHESFVV